MTTPDTLLALNVLEMVIQPKKKYPNYSRKNKMPYSAKQNKLFREFIIRLNQLVNKYKNKKILGYKTIKNISIFVYPGMPKIPKVYERGVLPKSNLL